MLSLALSLAACGGGGSADASLATSGVSTVGLAGLPGPGAPGGGGASPLLSANASVSGSADTAAAAGAATQPAGLSFSFTLAQPRSTSAGVYASSGALVRTLWRGESLGPGTFDRSWDQRDDQGQAVPPGDYTIRVAHHNVRYEWDGVVGNTSERAGATVPHKAFQLPNSLAATGRQMQYSVGYNEGQNALKGFDIGNPQENNGSLVQIDPFVAPAMIATDGRRLYWANIGGLAKVSFVAAFDLAGHKPARFGAGGPLCLNTWPNSSECYPSQKYDSVVEYRPSLDSFPTGLAVQRSGRLLAVAYAADNQVRLLDKDSGRLVQTLAVALEKGGTNQLAFSPGGDLWVVSGTSLLRYTGLSGSPVQAARVANLSKPLAVAVDPANEDAVWVADGGASQQLKQFDRDGGARATLGRAGGMGGSAQVSDDRLCFTQVPGSERTAVEVDADGAVWVVDTCNNRLVRFNSQGLMVNQIGYLPVVYLATVDGGNPTRVFANFLEFSVDYSKPLTDPKSWQLVRNWVAALPPELVDSNSGNGGFGGLSNVQTISNGRTYAQLAANGSSFIVELQADGSLRTVKKLPPSASGESPMQLYENGDLGYAATDNARQTVLRLPVDRFDARGDPVWASRPVTLASVPTSATAPYSHPGVFAGGRGPRFPVTSSGRVAFFNGDVGAESGFHLGAAGTGGSSWLWQSSPSGPLDGKGTFQTRRNDPSIQYGGNVVLAAGKHLVYGYHGEFYTDLLKGGVGQANQFMHFRDDGLFIGEFGVPSTRAVGPNQAGQSGNAFSPTLVRSGTETYLYHNDESTHGGVHRWHLVGLDDIQDLVGHSALNATVVLR
jgi:sugar lactone lactonase YvrE